MSRQDYSLRRREQAAVDFRTRFRKESGGRFNWPEITYVNPSDHTIGITASMVLDRNQLRSGYRVFNLVNNYGTIYHGYNDQVSVDDPDFILPGGCLQDVGEWQTIHQGEVWLVASYPGTVVRVEEIRVSPEWYYAYLRGGWW